MIPVVFGNGFRTVQAWGNTLFFPKFDVIVSSIDTGQKGLRRGAMRGGEERAVPDLDESLPSRGEGGGRLYGVCDVPA